MQYLLAVVASVLFSFSLIGFNETILKPIAVRLTKKAIKQYLKPAWDALDEKLVLPETLEKMVDSSSDWIFKTVVSEVAPELDAKTQELLTKTLVEEFSLKAFLEKSRFS